MRNLHEAASKFFTPRRIGAVVFVASAALTATSVHEANKFQEQKDNLPNIQARRELDNDISKISFAESALVYQHGYNRITYNPALSGANQYGNDFRFDIPPSPAHAREDINAALPSVENLDRSDAQKLIETRDSLPDEKSSTDDSVYANQRATLEEVRSHLKTIEEQYDPYEPTELYIKSMLAAFGAALGGLLVVGSGAYTLLSQDGRK